MASRTARSRCPRSAHSGTAGCVLARRLAEERNLSILLIERGDARDNWLDKTPLVSTHQFSDKKHSVVLQSRLRGDATTEIVTGKGLGGTSRINGLQYTRGVPGDYNAWAESGRQGWSYEELRPYFEKAEGHWSPVTHAHYGKSGPLQVQAPPPNFKFGVSREIAHAAEKLGFAICNDVNDARLPTSGCFLLHLTTAQDGYRSSTFRAYLPKHFVLAHRENLHICTKTIACKVEVKQSATGTLRATGVILQGTKPGSSTRFVAARKEVVLCCGAITTPQLLMLRSPSRLGIGPANHLQQVGVPVVHELDGVGSNLQDHMGCSDVATYHRL
ncbi:uncharacterized protein PHACADRAFT_197102 [Phanerochaete carnosa HHB-10118-sp]|uniref:Glucose-methanol-choline oxidoreductase N-terminal domain-containing protein n=1 Tax=Phanerochaete carnosa (strain HHB-10118-sp) TaxID=650164 RepID=K5W683_PHACS|nr:uncharacterized protein PHACADRAFT_197102 [Phanerochaete carnosa HHB-10118-sp]EKM54670.1 hypothetical protein PHACADRAFT_197102 [Phanerochaete carnosa HHB-10118-sp]